MNKAWAETVDIKTLVSVLEDAADAYHNGTDLVMSDTKFDVFLKVLRRRSPHHPFLRKIGYRPSEDPVTLPYHMGSLNKVDTEKDLAAWCKDDTGYVIMHKVDGVSAMLTYPSLKLYTRGDGDIGQDVSHLLAYFSYPKTSVLAIRGELFVPGGSRQDTVGIVNRKMHGREVPRLDFVAYEVISSPMMPPYAQMTLLRDLGVKTPFVKYVEGCPRDVEAVLAQERARGLPYPMDGLVIAANNFYEVAVSGNPSHAMAFKQSVYGPACTVVEGIEWTASRAGKMIPRVRLRPVTFGVEVVRYTTGYNARYIVENKLGPGAVVWVSLKGDVIPIIVRVQDPAPDPIQLPPETTWEGVHLVTSDDRVTLVKRLTHFVKTLGIRQVHEKTLETLIKETGIRSIDDLLELESSRIPFLGVLRRVLREEGVALAKLIVATAIMGPGIGIKKAQGISMNQEMAAFVSRHQIKLL